MTEPGGRRPLMIGNWKMHKTVGEARALVRELLATALPPEIDFVVAPPFTALEAVRDELRGSSIGLAAQTMHENDQGPFTGEISPLMLLELGVRYVVLGHSERRLYSGETNDGVNRKVRSALAHGITPVVAVGETDIEHRSGNTRSKVTLQTRVALEGLHRDAVTQCVVAYEPIWAIGTGRVEEPQGANDVIEVIRGAVGGLHDARILYGGSMKGDNAEALMAQPGIDGGLIGGASLGAKTFAAVGAAAAAGFAARRAVTPVPPA